MNDIFDRIRKAFDSLWNVRPRGASLEVITPFPASDDKYVSVFIVKQNGKYIVSDGGWLNDGTYQMDKEIPESSKIFDRIYDYFLKDFGVCRTQTPAGKIICFKSVEDLKFIPSIVFDMANFISFISSTALIPLRDEIEKRKIFRKQANAFILDRVGDDRLHTNTILTEHAPAARFNAIIDMPNNKKTLVNYVTGATTEYMIGSYCKSNTMFDLLSNQQNESLVKDKIIIMDDSATGFNEYSLTDFFTMSKAKGRKNILWSKDGRVLSEMIA